MYFTRRSKELFSARDGSLRLLSRVLCLMLPGCAAGVAAWLALPVVTTMLLS